MFKKIIAFIIVITFGIESTGYAQVAPVINIAAASAGVSAFERFRPVQLRSLIYDRDGNKFNILVDKGDARAITQPQMSAAAARLMEYFRTGVALPNSAFWVNLRPDAPTNIIDPALEKTDLGKVFLETDLALKKDMALATSPNTATGRKYWSRLYARAEELFGTRGVTVPTLTRPWIVPGDIIIRQSRSNAYVYKASLKVKIEQDHLKQAASGPAPAVDPRQEELNAYATQLVREIILPALTKKVNSSRAYADFRQAFYSLVLAQWFKKNFKGTNSQYAGLIDTGDLTGLVSRTPWSTQAYYEAYRTSFFEGEYNVSESVVGATGNRIRNYTSGGIVTDIFSGEASVNFVRYQNGFIPKGNVPLDGGTLQPVAMEGIEETLASGADEGRDMAASNNDAMRRDGGSASQGNELISAQRKEDLLLKIGGRLVSATQVPAEYGSRPWPEQLAGVRTRLEKNLASQAEFEEFNNFAHRRALILGRADMAAKIIAVGSVALLPFGGFIGPAVTALVFLSYLAWALKYSYVVHCARLLDEALADIAGKGENSWMIKVEPLVFKSHQANQKEELSVSSSSRDGGEMKRILKTAWWGVALPVALVSVFAFNAVLAVTWIPFIIGSGTTLSLVQVYAAFLPSLGAAAAGLGLGYLAGQYAEKRLLQRYFDRIAGQGIENQPFPKEPSRDGGHMRLIANGGLIITFAAGIVATFSGAWLWGTALFAYTAAGSYFYRKVMAESELSILRIGWPAPFDWAYMTVSTAMMSFITLLAISSGFPLAAAIGGISVAYGGSHLLRMGRTLHDGGSFQARPDQAGGTSVSSVAARHPLLFIGVDVLAILLFSTVMRLTFWGLGKDVPLMSPEFAAVIGVSSAIGYWFTQSVLSRRYDKANADGGSDRAWDWRYSEILREVEGEIWRDPRNGYGGSMGFDRLTESDQTRARAEAMNRLNDEKFGRGLGVRYEVVNNRIVERDGGMLLTNAKKRRLVRYLGALAHNISGADYRMREQSWSLYQPYFEESFAGREQFNEFGLYVVSAIRNEKLAVYGTGFLALASVALVTTVPAVTIGCCAVFAATFLWRAGVEYTTSKQDLLDALNYFSSRPMAFTGQADAQAAGLKDGGSVTGVVAGRPAGKGFIRNWLYGKSEMQMAKLGMFMFGAVALTVPLGIAAIMAGLGVSGGTVIFAYVFMAAACAFPGILIPGANQFRRWFIQIYADLHKDDNRNSLDAESVGTEQKDGGVATAAEVEKLKELAIGAKYDKGFTQVLSARRINEVLFALDQNQFAVAQLEDVINAVRKADIPAGSAPKVLSIFFNDRAQRALREQYAHFVLQVLMIRMTKIVKEQSGIDVLEIIREAGENAAGRKASKDGGMKTVHERLQLLEESELLYQKTLRNRFRHLSHSINNLKKMTFADQDLGGQSKTRDDRVASLVRYQRKTEDEIARSKEVLGGIRAEREEWRKARQHNIDMLEKNEEWAALINQRPWCAGSCDLYGKINWLGKRLTEGKQSAPVWFEVGYDVQGNPELSFFEVSARAKSVLPGIRENLEGFLRDEAHRDGGTVVHSIVSELLEMLTERIQAKDESGAIEVMTKLYILANPRMQEQIEALSRECNRRDFDKTADMLRDLRENETYLDWEKWVGVGGLQRVDALQDADGWYFWRDGRKGAEIARKVARSDWGQKDGGSDLGGIDVREMSIATRQVSAEAMLPRANAGLVSLKELDRQWVEIRTDMAKGQKPYQKMKAYVEVCSATAGTEKQLKAVTNCVANLVKHDEEEAAETSAELKDIIAQLG